MDLKKIFRGLSKLFDWLWNINLVLGIMSIVIVSINAFTGNKAITASYFGKFRFKLEKIGNIESIIGQADTYISEISATPSILINNSLHLILIYSYIAFILLIVLGYNYQLMKLFKALNIILNDSSIFIESIINRFKDLAKFSFLLFIIGLILTITKLIIIKQIVIQDIVFKPIFDSQIINLAWLGIGFTIISGIFKIGYQIQTENDLTI